MSKTKYNPSSTLLDSKFIAELLNELRGNISKLTLDQKIKLEQQLRDGAQQATNEALSNNSQDKATLLKGAEASRISADFVAQEIRNQREEEAEEARQAEWVFDIDVNWNKHSTAAAAHNQKPIKKDDGCCTVMTALNLPTNIDLFLTLEQEKQFNQASFAISNELSLETTNMLNEFACHPIISGPSMSGPSLDIIMVPAVLDQFTLEDLGQFIGAIHNYLTGSATET